MKARTGEDPGEVYAELAERFGAAAYKRTDVAATPSEKDVLKRLSPSRSRATSSRASRSSAVLTEAPGNGAPIGGLKVVAEHGWFAARPSGTEDVYKVYAESLDGEERLERIVEEAEQIVGRGAGERAGWRRRASPWCSRAARASGSRRSRSTAPSPPSRSAATTA